MQLLEVNHGSLFQSFSHSGIFFAQPNSEGDMERQIRNNSAKCDASCILYTDVDVANILLLPKKMIHKLVRDKKLACVQISPRIRRFTPEQVQQYIDSHSTPPPVDKKGTRPVLSAPKKGGDHRNRGEKTGVSKACLLDQLREEMRQW